MSGRLPNLDGQERPVDLAVLMREAFVALDERVLVIPTARGIEVVAIAQQLVPELEAEVGAILGAESGCATCAPISRPSAGRWRPRRPERPAEP